MNLPNPPEKYSREDQSRLRTEIAQGDKHNLKHGRDLHIGGGARLLLHSPDGSQWKITVSNDGVVSAVAA